MATPMTRKEKVDIRCAQKVNRHRVHVFIFIPPQCLRLSWLLEATRIVR